MSCNRDASDEISSSYRSRGIGTNWCAFSAELFEYSRLNCFEIIMARRTPTRSECKNDKYGGSYWCTTEFSLSRGIRDPDARPYIAWVRSDTVVGYIVFIFRIINVLLSNTIILDGHVRIECAIHIDFLDRSCDTLEDRFAACSSNR